MALSITPGYDYTVNEVPTKAKFEAAAAGLEITGLDLNVISGTIQAILFGDTTGASGGKPPAEGWIWVDPAGNRNVQFRAYPGSIAPSPLSTTDTRADVRMWRAAGGWETSRLLTQGFMAGDSLFFGQHMWVQGSPTFRVRDERLDMDVDNTFPFVSAHDVASPASSARLVGRGMVFLYVGANVTEYSINTHRPGFLTDSTNQIGMGIHSQFKQTKRFYAGAVLGPAPGSSTVSGGNTYPYATGWFTTKTAGKPLP